MEIYQAVVLGVVQGVTEFLPISSSGHLILFPWLLGWPDHGLTFDVALHMGTLAAVFLVFWRELLALARGALGGVRSAEGRLAWSIAAASVPAAVAGLVLEDVVDTAFRSPLLIAANLALMGLLLFWADGRSPSAHTAEQAGFGRVLLVGCAQALALVPGVSRSGVTMTAARLTGVGRTEAARLSFLLSAPITFGAGVLKLRHLTVADLTLAWWAGVLTSAVVGALVIRFLLGFLRRGTFLGFAAYRLFLALFIFTTWVVSTR